MELIQQAEQSFKENFPMQTWMERALFLGWYCGINDCKFCYMSTKTGQNKDAIRSAESILAEAFLCRKLGWPIGFVSGGVGAYSRHKFSDLLIKINQVIEDKVWINIGPLGAEELKTYKPYIKGVVGAIETINPKLHRFVCPSKPMEPYFEMFEKANELGISTAMTLILGIGETKEDFSLLKEIITKYKIKKIHIYSLNPQKGTYFEVVKTPAKEYHGWWISQTRISFPNIDIQAGIWLDRVDRVEYLLRCGANSLSKYPALRKFGSRESRIIEEQAKMAGREFLGTMTKVPEFDVDEVMALLFDEELKARIREKVVVYLESMKRLIA